MIQKNIDHIQKIELQVTERYKKCKWGQLKCVDLYSYTKVTPNTYFHAKGGKVGTN